MTSRNQIILCFLQIVFFFTSCEKHTQKDHVNSSQEKHTMEGDLDEIIYESEIFGSGVAELKITGQKITSIIDDLGQPREIKNTSIFENTFLGEMPGIGDDFIEDFEKEYVFEYNGRTIAILVNGGRVVRAFEFWSSY